MGLTLQDVIQGVRLSHPAFTKDTIPDRALGEGLGRAQRALAQAATRQNATYLEQRMTIALNLSSANALGVVGAGTSGGLPGLLTNGVVTVVEQLTGSALSYDLANAVTNYGPIAATSATSTTVTRTGAGRTVNGDANRLLWIQDGRGAGPDAVRLIASNTATVWTVSQAFGITPDSTSVFSVITAPVVVDQQHGAITGLPAYDTDSSYLVKLDANGVPYLDLATPLVTKVTTGVPLPPYDRLIGGTAMMSTGSNANPVVSTSNLTLAPYEWPLTIVHYENRHSAPRWPSGYVLGTTFYLLGTSSDWSGVQNIELRYVPIPPLFPVDSTALGTYFLLPDTAYDALVAQGEIIAARFATAKGTPVDEMGAFQRAQLASQAWLKSVGQQQGRTMRTGRRNR